MQTYLILSTIFSRNLYKGLRFFPLASRLTMKQVADVLEFRIYIDPADILLHYNYTVNSLIHIQTLIDKAVSVDQ